jgi:transposase
MGRKSIYTEEYRSEAVELANREGPAKAAKELGINPATLRRWQTEKKKTKKPADADLEKENNRLRKENEYLKKINEVLKKSHGIFAQDHLTNSKS